MQNALKRLCSQSEDDSLISEMEEIKKSKCAWHSTRYGRSMKKKKLGLIIPIAVSSFFLISSFPATMAENNGSTRENSNPPNEDNTAVNARDRNSNEVTADNAKQNKEDVLLMQKIRRALIQNRKLSTYAHNIKIVAQNGVITLKGPVNSQDEIHTIVATATEIAGGSNVRDQLSVRN